MIPDWVHAVPGLRWIVDASVNAVKGRRERRAGHDRDARKAQIMRVMHRAGPPGGVSLVHRSYIASALQLSATEIQLLLDELAAEGKIFRCLPPLPPDHYSVSGWHPDPARLHGR